MAEKKRRTLPVAKIGEDIIPRWLKIIESGQEIEVPAKGEILIVGSAAGSSLILDDRFVSAEHCEIAWTGDALVVRDRRSRNGTYVNGARIRECLVPVGARIQVGGTNIEIVGQHRATQSAAELLVGDDARFRSAIDQTRLSAATSANLILIGESGTGKELFARLVHESSPRAAAPFVAVNCGAIPRDLIESELFGHEKGSFTGALERRHGVFEQAHGGTLFLDEIGELPIAQQPRLLRVLETRRLRRVGAEAERGVDVRVVAATHRDLRIDGRFRQDLYHRLAGMEIRLPPLRERRGDIALLAQHVLDELAPGRTLRPATLSKLRAHAWPGNVRELRNVIQSLVFLGEDRVEERLRAWPLSMPIAFESAPAASSEMAPVAPASEAARAPESFDDAIRRIIGEALAMHKSHRKAAEAIRMPKSTFYDRVRRYGLRAPSRTKPPQS